jgi:cysteinyl-tRNA synthetase
MNVYINSSGRKANVSVVKQSATWIGDMLRMFGLGEGQASEIGWGQEDEGAGGVNVRFLLNILCYLILIIQLSEKKR